MHTTLTVTLVRICAAAAFLFSTLSLHGGYVTGVTATTTMGSGFGANIQNTVNGAGLSSRSLTATHDGTSPTNSWVSSGTLIGTITFKLPQTVFLTGFSFWNQNAGGPGATGSTGIKGLEITYSNDGTTFIPLPGAPTTLNRVTVAVAAPAQVVSFPAVMASYVRFQVLNNYGDVGQTGFAEVAFARNDSPTIKAADTITTGEDAVANFDVEIADPDGDPNEPAIVTFSTPALGTITGSGGSYTYTPNLNANGADSFTIKAIDSLGAESSKTVGVTITALNDAPEFANVPATLMTDEDSVASFAINATDVDGDSITFSFSDATQGTVSATPDGYVYTPNANANGADSFTIIATDGQGGSANQTVNVSINAINDAPSFTNLPETLTTDEDNPVNFLVSTSDADGDLVTLDFPQLAHGTVNGSEGNYVYVPAPNANGTGTLTITASDGKGGVTTATVTLTILPVNDAPLFTTIPTALSTDEDTASAFTIVASDEEGDLVAISVSGAAQGTVSGGAGNYVYTPNPNANGSDSLTFTAEDGNGGTTSATVNVTITPVNDAPMFVEIPTTVTTDIDTPKTFRVSTTDTEGDSVTVAFSGAAKGVVAGSNSEFSYTPNAGETGGDTFTVTATDAQGATTTAIVQVTIVGYPAKYGLLLGDASGVHAALTLQLSSHGFLTGNVRDENNRRMTFHRAHLPAEENAVTLSLNDGSSLTLQFESRRRVSATLNTAGRELNGEGTVAVIPPAGVAGRYTTVLDSGSGGFGWCLLVVNKRGAVRILGKLPDGSSIIAHQGMPVNRENNAPLFLLGKGRKEARVSGWLHFATQAQSDVTGSLLFHTGGSDTACEATGSHFSAAKSALPPASYPLVFEGAGVSHATTVTLSQDNRATAPKPVLSFTPSGGPGHLATGLFKVKFRPPDLAATAPRPVLSGSGVFIQKLEKGFGQFINGGATGKVLVGQ